VRNSARREEALPLRVVIHTGLYLEHDAISESARRRMRYFDGRKDVRVRLFCHATDSADSRVRVVADLVSALTDPDFVEADLRIYEFGIHYPLFQTILLPSLSGARLVVYHNLTPPHLLADASARAAIEQGMIDRDALFVADLVECIGAWSGHELQVLGLDLEVLAVNPLPSTLPVLPRAPVYPPELLFIGRLVEAKGVLELIEAVRMLVADGLDLRLRVVGSSRMSLEPAVDAALTSAAEDGLPLELESALTSDELASRLAVAAALVVPSHHEGYCVPVIEAFEASCPVIAYDNSNLPSVVGRLGVLVPTGDVAALASAMASVVRLASTAGDAVLTAEGEVPFQQWDDERRLHLSGFSFRAWTDRFERNIELALAQARQRRERPLQGMVPA